MPSVIHETNTGSSASRTTDRAFGTVHTRSNKPPLFVTSVTGEW
ncbi:MAG: hypothetical protein ACKORY_01235 [Actinomycetota bacterium]